MRKISLCMFASLVLLTACNPPDVKHYTPPSFTKLAPFNMDVASVNITEEYKTSSQAPHVEGLFQTTPTEGVRIWMRDRVHAVGGGRTLTVIIKDASVTETKIPPSTSTGTFLHEEGSRYDAHIEVELRIYAENKPISEASIDVSATRSDTLGGRASAADREKLFDEMERNLLNSLNGELEKNFYRYFSNYIRYTS